MKIYVSAKDHGTPPLSSVKPVLVVVYIGTVFPITVTTLKQTTTTIKLRFTMVNITLDDISHIGVVVQGTDSIADCKYEWAVT